MRISVTEVDPIIELMKRLRRAARTPNGKLHLSNEVARVLLRHDIYQILARMEAEEMRKACVSATANDNNLDSSGSGKGRTPEPGTSAGSKNVLEMEATSRGARLRLSEEVRQISHLRQQTTR
jgi:hypothetical protein